MLPTQTDTDVLIVGAGPLARQQRLGRPAPDLMSLSLMPRPFRAISHAVMV